MAYAFGHLISGWIIGKVGEHKVKFSRIEWFLLLLGAVIPDIDYLFDWVLRTHSHRNFTHSLMFAILGFLIIYFIIKLFRKELNAKKLGMIFAIGISTHLFIDMIMGYPGTTLLWPLGHRFWIFGYLNQYAVIALKDTTREELLRKMKMMILDMGLGTAWIFYLLIKGKIKEF